MRSRPTNDLANTNASAFRKISSAVELATPADSTTIANQVTFNWTDYLATNEALGVPVHQEAKTYKIEVSLAADFSTIFDTATVDQTTYTPFSKTYPEGPLYWRVQTIDDSGNTLTKSPARLVNKISPKVVPTFPTNGSTQSGVPFFQWTPQAYAATYLVEIYKNGDTNFSPANKVLNATTKFSAWAPTTSLPTGDYAWRVRRNDADNRAGPWSNARTFTLAAAKPSLIAPANAATVSAEDAALHLDGRHRRRSVSLRSRGDLFVLATHVQPGHGHDRVGADHGLRQRLVLLAGDGARRGGQHDLDVVDADVHDRDDPASAGERDHLHAGRPGPDARLAQWSVSGCRASSTRTRLAC